MSKRQNTPVEFPEFNATPKKIEVRKQYADLSNFVNTYQDYDNIDELTKDISSRMKAFVNKHFLNRDGVIVDQKTICVQLVSGQYHDEIEVRFVQYRDETEAEIAGRRKVYDREKAKHEKTLAQLEATERAQLKRLLKKYGEPK